MTKDGETFYYFFNKSGNQNSADDYGKALTATVKDGYLYGRDGRCLTADDGNSYAVYAVADISAAGIEVFGKTGDDRVITVDAPNADMDAAYVIVSRSGRIKQNGTATIDGIKYKIDKYKVVNSEVID